MTPVTWLTIPGALSYRFCYSTLQPRQIVFKVRRRHSTSRRVAVVLREVVTGPMMEVRPC